MNRRIFFMTLMFLSAGASHGWTGDCAQFISDFQEGKIVSSKAYQFESDQLYVSADYCPFSPLSFVSNQNNRVEFYLVEQCRETGYKVLKTTLLCVQDPKAAKVRSTCDVQGQLLSPCLKDQLTQVLAPTEPS